MTFVPVFQVGDKVTYVLRDSGDNKDRQGTIIAVDIDDTVLPYKVQEDGGGDEWGHWVSEAHVKPRVGVPVEDAVEAAPKPEFDGPDYAKVTEAIRILAEAFGVLAEVQSTPEGKVLVDVSDLETIISDVEALQEKVAGMDYELSDAASNVESALEEVQNAASGLDGLTGRYGDLGNVQNTAEEAASEAESILDNLRDLAALAE